jgi:phage tail sheath protein FI
MTPWVISPSGVRLFRFHHISHGTMTNRDVKVAVDNIITSTTLGVNSTFNIVVRRYNDTDTVPFVLEQFNNVSINANDNSSYLVAKIGDIYSQYNSTLNKVVTFGNYANSSNYIRVEVGDAVKNGTLDPSTVPGGFEAVFETIVGFAGSSLPSASMLQSSASSLTFSGFDYSNADNINYLNPVPQEAGNGNNVNFLLNSNDIKFMLPFQYGTDGMNYTVIPNRGNQITATNTFGFDLSTAQSAGALSYIQAFNIISDRDQYSFNILGTPGVINNIHAPVISNALSMVISRGDAIYILDLAGHDDTIATATVQAASIDSSYGCAYYPWVKILDGVTGKLTSVPPSVVIPQTFAYTDTVSHPWFAPAGLNRGGIGGVIDVVNKLNKSDRDTLYVAKVNPIASFPNTGITVWGQKTLQVNQNTALTRINVRRLLITLEAQIRQISNFLIFENNTVALRNQFLNKVNPYLSQVQAQQGLYAYKVVMDDSNNTPSVIDQNQLIGAIYLQPAKAVEFIILTFNITPTGVTF